MYLIYLFFFCMLLLFDYKNKPSSYYSRIPYSFRNKKQMSGTIPI